jgi:Tfp pilus assembly protein PilF
MDEEILHSFRRSDDPAAREAEACFRQAYECQMGGKLEEAVGHYRRSIELFATAEAHTFLGWTYSFQGKLQEAIRECERAIKVDPEFGNPYNDIGAYLIEMGRPAEAVSWLRKAVAAARYQPRHFPHINLARAHAMQGELAEAIRELRESLRIEPENPSAERELRRLLARVN